MDKHAVHAFIDAANLWEAQKVKGLMFDMRKLRDFLKNQHSATELEVHYYVAYPAKGTRQYDTDGRHKFFVFLKKGLEFNVIKKELKRIHITTDLGQAVLEKGNMDVEISIGMVHNVERYDTAVLFSGDSDFLPLVAYARNRGKKVYIYSSKNNVSIELRNGGDGYTDVLSIKDDIWGKVIERRESTTQAGA